MAENWHDTIADSFTSALRTAAGWGNFIIGGACLKHVRKDRTCQVLQEKCVPEYAITFDEQVERKRFQVGLALAGQVAVIACRLMTGHFTCACLGLVVYILGNNARCSLYIPTVSGFIAVGFAAGCLDTLELLHRLTSGVAGFYTFPFDANLVNDLSAMAFVLAPVTEVGGAALALDIYSMQKFNPPAVPNDVWVLHQQKILHMRSILCCGQGKGAPRNFTCQGPTADCIEDDGPLALPYLPQNVAAAATPTTAPNPNELGNCVSHANQLEADTSSRAWPWRWLPADAIKGIVEDVIAAVVPTDNSVIGVSAGVAEPAHLPTEISATADDAARSGPHECRKCAQCGSPAAWRGSGHWSQRSYCEACWHDWQHTPSATNGQIQRLHLFGW